MRSELDQILFNEHDGPVLALAFNPEGAVLASADAQGTVKLWDAAAEALLASLRGHTSAA